MNKFLSLEIDSDIAEALQRAAAANGHSPGVELQDILRRHFGHEQPAKRSFKQVLASMPYFNDDDLFEMR